MGTPGSTKEKVKGKKILHQPKSIPQPSQKINQISRSINNVQNCPRPKITKERRYHPIDRDIFIIKVIVSFPLDGPKYLKATSFFPSLPHKRTAPSK